MIRAYASGMASYGWKDAAKLMIEAHSLPYEAAQVAFTLNPEPMKFVLEGKRGPRGGRGKFYYNEDSTWPMRWDAMYRKGDVHAVWPILKRMKGAKIGPASMMKVYDLPRWMGFDLAGLEQRILDMKPGMIVHDEVSFIGKSVPDLLTLGTSMTQIDHKVSPTGRREWCTHQIDMWRYLLMPKEKNDDPS